VKVPAKDVIFLFYVLRLKSVPVLIYKTETSCEVVSGEEGIKKWLRVNSVGKKPLRVFVCTGRTWCMQFEQ